jgi:O-antigen ligase
MSKTAIIILISLTILRQFYGNKKRKRLLIMTGAIAVLFITTQTGIKSFLNIKSDTSEISHSESNLKIRYRMIIWECAALISKENPNIFFGIGFKETNNKLISCYKKNIEDKFTKQFLISKKFNTHNQYVDLFLSSGLVSLLLFLGILLFLFSKHHKDFFHTALLLIIFLFGMAENYFHRQVGVYYFGFILAMLLYNNLYDSKNIIKEPSYNNNQ